MNLMTDGLGFAFADFPVAKPRAHRADAELAIDAPRLRIAAVFRVVKNRDVPPVAAAVDLHADVEPRSAPALGSRANFARAVDDAALRAGLPRHTEKQPAVIVFADRDIGSRLAAPFEVEDVAAAVGAH